jgi:hypothetical protein
MAASARMLTEEAEAMPGNPRKNAARRTILEKTWERGEGDLR